MTRQRPSGLLTSLLVCAAFVASTSFALAADKAAAPPAETAPAQSGSDAEAPPAAGQSTQGKSQDAQAFGYDQVVEKAKALATKPYAAPPQIPKFLQDFDFAKLDQIQFKTDQALWHDAGLGFEAMFYHPGSYYTHPVKMNLVNGNGVTPFGFDKNRYSYPNDDLKNRVPDDLGYAGFKLLHELSTPGKLDEVQSFLGASYFRGLGADEHYGLSARGLAIDTGSDKGEEFPSFIEFWLVEPADGADDITVYGLLNSPSLAGAYRFVITPGTATVTHVETTLFTRKAIAKLGVAPLTSMFTWGENSLTRLDDFRPEAHDSDGMLISSANGEWVWRPLVNPQKLWMNQFSANNVRGFGLLQRDRDFDHYQDLDYEYEKRPSAWITPSGDWGEGHLELVQIPSDSEVNDNIALYWVPNEPVTASQRLHYSYDIRWSEEPAAPDSFGHAVATRVGRAAVVPGQPRNTIQVAVEFTGGELAKLTDPNSVQPRVNAMRDATINNIQAVPNPHTGGWRLTFLVPTDSLGSPLELRAFLSDANGGALTETWTYALSP